MWSALEETTEQDRREVVTRPPFSRNRLETPSTGSVDWHVAILAGDRRRHIIGPNTSKSFLRPVLIYVMISRRNGGRP